MGAGHTEKAMKMGRDVVPVTLRAKMRVARPVSILGGVMAEP